MKQKSKQFLIRLVNSISPSGYEAEAAAVWEAEAKTFAAEVRRDSHGNTDAIVNPGGSPRIMLSGHYDEIGFLITHIDDDGFLWIAPVGGWDPQIVQGQRVTIRGKQGHVSGVVGKCPIHLQKPDDRKKVMEISEMWVDIGVTSRKEAEKLVGIGDPLVLAQAYLDLQGDRAAARGFDNRAGAFVVLEAARRAAGLSPRAEIHAVATVQEEIGLRGARTAAYGIDPAVGIAVDVTFATDQPGIGDAAKREGKIKMGEGAVIARGANINAKLFDLLVATATEEKIPYQISAEPGGTGTDANAIQLNRAGVATALVSIPNRYMHSPCEMVSLKDVESCIHLIASTIVRVGPDTRFIPF
jgi:endoglucanase